MVTGIGPAIERLQVQLLVLEVLLSGNNSGQVVHTMCLSQKQYNWGTADKLCSLAANSVSPLSGLCTSHQHGSVADCLETGIGFSPSSKHVDFFTTKMPQAMQKY